MEKKRRRINRFGHDTVSKLKELGKSFEHDIDHRTPFFFRPDGVHLSPVGLDMYLNTLSDQLLAHL